MSKKEFQYIHIDVNLTINEDDWGTYNDPKASESLRFNMPLEMFNETNFKNMVSNAISRLEKQFPIEKGRFEAEVEQARLEEEAKAQVEEQTE
jgi:hypothetical protein